MSLLNKAMENLLVAKSEALISAHYKNIDKTIFSKTKTRNSTDSLLTVITDLLILLQVMSCFSCQ